VKNSYFRNGLFFLDENAHSSGRISIQNSLFTNNTGEYGSIFHIGYIDERSGSKVSSSYSTFIGNKAFKYGGVIYSMDHYHNYHTSFLFNNFTDNHAKLGDIMYTYSKVWPSNISYINNYEENNGIIVTNPSKFIIDEDSISSISIYSGDIIPNNIKCKWEIILKL